MIAPHTPMAASLQVDNGLVDAEICGKTLYHRGKKKVYEQGYCPSRKYCHRVYYASNLAYNFAFQAARSEHSNGFCLPSQNSGLSWNHFSRLQSECTDRL